ncbi:MAG: hypothetical protein ACOCXH_11230 [Cyclobacteriaceae bacterium]
MGRIEGFSAEKVKYRLLPGIKISFIYGVMITNGGSREPSFVFYSICSGIHFILAILYPCKFGIRAAMYHSPSYFLMGN